MTRLARVSWGAAMRNVEGRFVIWHLRDRGCSVSEIAGESGHDRKTAPKVLPQELLPTPKPRQARAYRIEPFAIIHREV